MSWLEDELHEQPAALARLIERQRENARRVAELLAAEDVRYVLIASRGSSSNAARYAQYLLGRAHRVPVMFATPSLYTIYEQPPRLDGAAVVGISQSGASPDVASVLAEARRQGRPTVALTNEPDSPLAREADAVLLLEAGPERAVAATKTYSNSLGAIAMIFAAVDGPEAESELERMPAVLAEQIALKIRELSGLVVEAYSPADLMHGPIGAIQPGWPVVLVAPSGPARPSVEDVVLPLQGRGARLLAVSDVGAVLRRAHTRLPLVPHVPEWLSPLTAVVPGQVTAMRLARLRGLDVDRPAGLNKVTLTR